MQELYFRLQLTLVESIQKRDIQKAKKVSRILKFMAIRGVK